MRNLVINFFGIVALFNIIVISTAVTLAPDSVQGQANWQDTCVVKLSDQAKQEIYQAIFQSFDCLGIIPNQVITDDQGICQTWIFNFYDFNRIENTGMTVIVSFSLAPGVKPGNMVYALVYTACNGDGEVCKVQPSEVYIIGKLMSIKGVPLVCRGAYQI